MCDEGGLLLLVLRGLPARTPGCAHSARTPAKSWSNFSLSNFRAVGSFGGPKLVQGDL